MGCTGWGISISESSVGPKNSPHAKPGVGVVVGMVTCVEVGDKVRVDKGAISSVPVGPDLGKWMDSDMGEFGGIITGAAELHAPRMTHKMQMMNR
jgi:hypothetical protein